MQLTTVTTTQLGISRRIYAGRIIEKLDKCCKKTSFIINKIDITAISHNTAAHTLCRQLILINISKRLLIFHVVYM